MPNSLQALESQRVDLVQQIAVLGDLRSGSISDTSDRCRKSNCRCPQPGNPVHGPNPRLTYKHQGKTIAESLPTPDAQKLRDLSVSRVVKRIEAGRLCFEHQLDCDFETFINV